MTIVYSPMASQKGLLPRERILKCALREFSKYGYAGGRVARITRAAKVNARMLFYYFGNKEKLFAAVLESVWKEGVLIEEAPPMPAQSLIFWSEFYRNNPDWSRMVLWEGLENRTSEFADEAGRRKNWQESLNKMRLHTGRGGWPDLDLPHLLLSLIALELAPLSMPHLARLITGKHPSSPEFIAGREAFLRDFADFLTRRRARPRAAAKSKRPSRKARSRKITG